MKVILVFVFCVILYQPTKAGWVITEESSDKFGNMTIQKTFIQNNYIRYETPTTIAIVDLNIGIITIIFSQHKAYWSGTSDELLQSTLSIYDNELEKMIVRLPKNDRNELDSIYQNIRTQMLDSSNDSISEMISVKKSNDIDTVYDYGTVKYDVFFDTLLIESVWYTDDLVPFKELYLSDMIKFEHQVEQIPSKGSITQTHEYYELLKSGMILKSVIYSPDSNNLQTIVTNIRNTNIVTDFFKPPSNYIKTSLYDALYMMTDKSD